MIDGRIECHDVGAVVDISFGDDAKILGIITAVCIRPGSSGYSVRYEINWWSGRDRKTEWFGENEFAPHCYDGKTLEVGFKSG